MKITWKGRARLLTITEGEGDKAKRSELLVEPGNDYTVPDGTKLSGEGVNWEKAKAAPKGDN